MEQTHFLLANFVFDASSVGCSNITGICLCLCIYQRFDHHHDEWTDCIVNDIDWMYWYSTGECHFAVSDQLQCISDADP